MVGGSGGIVAMMVLYMGVCLVLGFIAYRRTFNLGDFILGGRSLGSFVCAFSAQATDMSGWLLLGLPGLAYASGFDSIWMVTGLAVGTYLNWKFVAALYELVPGFVFSLLAIWLVSLATQPAVREGITHDVA